MKNVLREGEVALSKQALDGDARNIYVTGFAPRKSGFPVDLVVKWVRETIIERRRRLDRRAVLGRVGTVVAAHQVGGG